VQYVHYGRTPAEIDCITGRDPLTGTTVGASCPKSLLVMIALRSIPRSAVVGRESRRDSGGPVEKSYPFFKFQCFAGYRVCHVRGAHIFARQPSPCWGHGSGHVPTQRS
jgi:hypothetical protein